MSTPKMYARFFYNESQLEQFVNINSLSSGEFFSIIPHARTRGNSQYIGHYLYFFTERQLLCDVFTRLTNSRQEQIKIKLNGLLDDKNIYTVLEKNLKYLKLWSDPPYDKFNESNILDKLYPILIYYTDITNEPFENLEIAKSIIEMNPYLLNVRDFKSK
jgi:hypothetical protein